MAYITSRGGRALVPTLKHEKYLALHWADIGYCNWAGEHPVQFSPADVKGWAELSARQISPWEFKVLRKMSREFASQAVRSRENDCPAPWGDPEMQFDKALVSKGLSSMLKNRKSKGKA